MPIVARVNPENVTQITALPGVRNETQVRPVQGIAEVGQQFAGLARDHYEKEKKRNDLTAVMAARRELSDWEASTFDPENANGIGKYRGSAALGADDALVPDLDKRVGEIGGRLTPDQRQQFDQVAFNFRDSVRGRLNGHMQREHEGFLASEQKATIGNLQNDAVSAHLSGDPALAENRLMELLAAQEALDATGGFGPESQTARANRTALVSGHHQQILASLVESDYAAAEDYLSENRAGMQPDAIRRVEAVLRPIAEAGDDEVLADVILSGGSAHTGVDGGLSARSANDPVSVQRDFRSIAEKHGATITSMVRPIIARGAGARSQHPKGTAADFRTKDKTPEQVTAMMADLRASGFEVHDERNTDQPHIHAEVPSGSRGGAAVTMAAVGSLGEALTKARELQPDPRRRKGLETAIRSRWGVQEADRADRERTTMERLREKAGAGGGSFAATLGADYEEAQRQGWLPALKSIWESGRTGQLVDTDPVTYDRFARLATSDPKAFADKGTIVEIWKAGDQLATADLARLQSAWVDANDPKKADGAQACRQVEAALINEGLVKLGWTKPESKDRAATFGLAIAQARAAFRASNPGKEPTPDQDRVIVGNVVQRFVSDPDKWVKQTRALSGYGLTLSAPDRARAVKALAVLGITKPTDSQIVATVADMENGATQ